MEHKANQNLMTTIMDVSDGLSLRIVTCRQDQSVVDGYRN